MFFSKQKCPPEQLPLFKEWQQNMMIYESVYSKSMLMGQDLVAHLPQHEGSNAQMRSFWRLRARQICEYWMGRIFKDMTALKERITVRKHAAGGKNG